MKSLRLFLAPFVPLYWAGLQVHQAWQRLRGVLVPPVYTIGVGNLRYGGTGKTPLVQFLAQHFLEKGHRVAVVTRGYRRRAHHPQVVEPGESVRPEEVGDEAFLLYTTLRQRIFLFVGKRREQMLQEAARRGVTVALLDDNFQYLRVRPHRQILLLVPDDFHAWLLPAGPLREPLSAVHRADFVVINYKNRKPRETLEIPGKPVFSLHYRVPEFWEVNTGQRVPAGKLRDVPVAVFCGIAEPESFVASVLATGARIVAMRCFLDHHWYTRRDLERLQEAARRAGARYFITTEKDAVRLPEPLPDLLTPRLQLVLHPEGPFWQALEPPP